MSKLLYVVGLVCMVWVIYDVWSKDKYDNVGKIAWTIAAIFFNILTAIVYALFGRR
ncbi:PLDc N-terminal domain-containing protein [Marinigracilibium pacificum]|uniref:PLDc_N domain-containing protein n=1 Tax=Marinigracilibium pacificum TaxID=2729599 RepID=A0A848IZ03_9BACT|nr:PLDc N-terminal domain-containing protein [Marinigracilibium pacificum]NMM48866.1 PLDc_N domain-containing protein [Marinigracilibium pacificum]